MSQIESRGTSSGFTRRFGVLLCTATVATTGVVALQASNIAPPSLQSVAHAQQPKQERIVRDKDGYITTNILKSVNLVYKGVNVDPNDALFWKSHAVQREGRPDGSLEVRAGERRRKDGEALSYYERFGHIEYTLALPPGVRFGDKVELTLQPSEITPNDAHVGEFGPDAFLPEIYPTETNTALFINDGSERIRVGSVRSEGLFSDSRHEVTVIFDGDVTRLAAGGEVTFSTGFPDFSVSDVTTVMTSNPKLDGKYVMPGMQTPHVVAHRAIQRGVSYDTTDGSGVVYAKTPYINTRRYKAQSVPRTGSVHTLENTRVHKENGKTTTIRESYRAQQAVFDWTLNGALAKDVYVGRFPAASKRGDVVFEVMVGMNIDRVNFHTRCAKIDSFTDSYKRYEASAGGNTQFEHGDEIACAAPKVERVLPDQRINAHEVIDSAYYRLVDTEVSDTGTPFKRYRVTIPNVDASTHVFLLADAFVRNTQFSRPYNYTTLFSKLQTQSDDVLARSIVDNRAMSEKILSDDEGRTLYDQAQIRLKMWPSYAYNYMAAIAEPAPNTGNVDPNVVRAKSTMQVFVNDTGYTNKSATTGKTAAGQDATGDTVPVVVNPTGAQYTLNVKNTGSTVLFDPTVYVDGKELPIAWAKVQKGDKVVDIDLHSTSLDYKDLFVPGDTLYLGVEEKDLGALKGDATKRAKVTFAGDVTAEDTAKITTYQERHLSKVTKRGDTPVWDLYRNDQDTTPVGTVDLTHITAELEKLRNAAPNVTTIQQLITNVDKFIKGLDSLNISESLPDNDREKYIKWFDEKLRATRGFEERLNEIKANLIVSIEHNAKNDTYTLKRADGTVVPGIIDASGIRSVETNPAGGVTITDAQGKRTVVGNTAYTFREIGTKGTPGYKIVLQEALPGGTPRDVATFNAYDGYITKVEQLPNSDVILTRLDGVQFTLSLSEIRDNIAHAQNTIMTKEELAAIAAELDRVSSEVDTYAANTNQSFETVQKELQSLRDALVKLNSRADKVAQKVLTTIVTDPQQPGVYDFTYNDGSTMRVIARGAQKIERVEGGKKGNLLRVTDALGRTQDVDIRDLTVDYTDDTHERVRITLPDGATLEFSTRDDKLVDVSKSVNGDYVFVSSTGQRWVMPLVALYKQLDAALKQVEQSRDQHDAHSAENTAALRVAQRDVADVQRALDAAQAKLAALVAVTKYHNEVTEHMVQRLDSMDAQLRTQTEQLVAEQIRLDGVDAVLRDITTQLDVIDQRIATLDTRVNVAERRVTDHSSALEVLTTDGIVDARALNCSGNVLLSLLPLIASVPAALTVYQAALPQLGRDQASAASVTTLGVLGVVSLIASGVTYSSCRS